MNVADVPMEKKKLVKQVHIFNVFYKEDKQIWHESDEVSSRQAYFILKNTKRKDLTIIITQCYKTYKKNINFLCN